MVEALTAPMNAPPTRPTLLTASPMAAPPKVPQTRRAALEPFSRMNKAQRMQEGPYTKPPTMPMGNQHNLRSSRSWMARKWWQWRRMDMGCPLPAEDAIDTTFLPRGLTERKWNSRFATVSGDRHHVFTERVDREQMNFAFRYSFGRSTPRFYREGWPRDNELCVSLQFWAIDTTLLARGLLSGWPSPSRPAE